MDGYGESDGSDDGFKDSPSDSDGSDDGFKDSPSESGKEVDGCSDTADTDGFNEGGRDGSGVIEVPRNRAQECATNKFVTHF